MSAGADSRHGRSPLFADRNESIRASLWLGRRRCWVALDGTGAVLGAVVLSSRPDQAMRIYAFGPRFSWRGSPRRRRFYDIRTAAWDISALFGSDTFPGGRAEQILDPATRDVIATRQRSAPVAPQRLARFPRFASPTLAEAIATLASIRSAYADYELDARKLLAFPTIIDPHDPITEAWYQAFTEANSLEPEDPSRTPPDHAERFVAATSAAEKAWEAAEVNARAVALNRMTPEQRNRIRQARRALDLALDPSTLSGERSVALATALSLLDGIVDLPAVTRETVRKSVGFTSPPSISSADSTNLTT